MCSPVLVTCPIQPIRIANAVDYRQGISILLKLNLKGLDNGVTHNGQSPGDNVTDRFFLDIRDPATFDGKIAPLTNALNGEEALPCVLLGAAYLDKSLLGLLETVFLGTPISETARDLLKSDRGLIGTLHTRAQMAYLLRLINKPLFINIGHIGTIRNLFAHSHEPLSFESQEIVALCGKLELPDPDVSVSDASAKAYFLLHEKNPRSRFVSAVMNTLIPLMFAQSKAKKLSEYDKPPDATIKP